MGKPRVFVTRRMNQDALDVIAGETEMEVWPEERPPSAAELKGKLRQMDGVLTNIMDRVDGPLVESAVRLRVVSQLAAGVDNIDVAEMTRRGIPVGYTPGVLSKATADLAFALLMAAARRVVESERWVRQGNWKLAFHPNYWLGADVGGATLGIVGMGKIGLEMAKRARGFDMRVLYHSRSRVPREEERLPMEYAEMDRLLQESDFVSLHVPLTDATYHLIGEGELRKMKPTAILVNAARGPVVDSRALYRALKEGWIAGAALDVTDPEPLPAGDPLLSLDNLVVTPHIGSAGLGSRRAMCMLAARNLLAGVSGERLVHCCNPEVYDSR
jgi:glyoxylate reductase